MAQPDKQAQAREIKLAAMESALKDEIAAWMPKAKAETLFTVQYGATGALSVHDPRAVMIALQDWLMDGRRSAVFIVRPAKGKSG